MAKPTVEVKVDLDSALEEIKATIRETLKESAPTSGCLWNEGTKAAPSESSAAEEIIKMLETYKYRKSLRRGMSTETEGLWIAVMTICEKYK